MDKHIEECIKDTDMFKILSLEHGKEDALAEIDLAVSNFVYDTHGNVFDPVALEDAVIDLMGSCDCEMEFIRIASMYPFDTDYHKVYLDGDYKELDDIEFGSLDHFSAELDFKNGCYEVISPQLTEVQKFVSIDECFNFFDYMQDAFAEKWYGDLTIKTDNNCYDTWTLGKNILKRKLAKFFEEKILNLYKQQDLF